MNIDQSNVRDPPDLEPDWLFPYPDCFHSDEPAGTEEETKLIHLQARKAIDYLRLRPDYLEEPFFEILKLGIEDYQMTSSSSNTMSASERPKLVKVIDIGQGAISRSCGPKITFCDPEELEIHLLRKRTVKSAKKRLIIVHDCQPEQALLLYLGSAQSEKLSIAGLLTRHKLRENFMRDHAQREANLWITELHLNFYRKIDLSNTPQHFTSAFMGPVADNPENLSAFPGESMSSLNRLAKGVISWRFSGDLHDRRWTGTILAFVPGMEGDSYWITISDLEIEQGYSATRFHGQRKLIEARLFSEMTRTVHVSTKEILSDLNKVLDDREWSIHECSSEHHDPFSEGFDQSYAKSRLYLQLSDFLSHLGNSFESIMKTIDDYMQRENQRPVQPRWSIDDEIQYRPELRKWDQESQKSVASLRSLRDEIKTKMGRAQQLRESLNADMQLRETRLQARSAEDVRLFTYVTIVFLPISFAASLFSMQQTPYTSLVGDFVKVAVIALIITLIVLSNLKTVSRNVWASINLGLHSTSRFMGTSSWAFWKETHEELVQTEKRNIQADETLQSQKTSKWWYCLFLLTYILMELPASRVLLACDATFLSNAKDLPQPKLPRKILRVILGLLSLPIFILVYTVIFLLQNLIDLLLQLFSLLKMDNGNFIRLSISSAGSLQQEKNPKNNKTGELGIGKRVSKFLKHSTTAKTSDGNWEADDTSVADDKEPIRAYEEVFNERVAQLTHPPRRFRSRVTRPDGSNRSDVGDQDLGMDEDPISEGWGDSSADKAEENDRGVEDGPGPCTDVKIRGVGILDRLGLKAWVKKASQTAQDEPV